MTRATYAGRTLAGMIALWVSWTLPTGRVRDAGGCGGLSATMALKLVGNSLLDRRSSSSWPPPRRRRPATVEAVDLCIATADFALFTTPAMIARTQTYYTRTDFTWHCRTGESCDDVSCISISSTLWYTHLISVHIKHCIIQAYSSSSMQAATANRTVGRRIQWSALIKLPVN